MAATSQTGEIAGSGAAPAYNASCQPGSVLVGVYGMNNAFIRAIGPICVTTTGKVWSAAPTRGAQVGSGGTSAFTRMCPVNTVVKSIEGRSGAWLDRITVKCQALNEIGAYTGAITTLASVGGSGGSARPAVSCEADQAPRGLFGRSTATQVYSLGMSCATRIEGLKGVKVPEPSNLSEFVADKKVAIALGKALFWDMQVGSDGVQACATCHFHAGADSRNKNQISPGLARASSPTVANPDNTFQVGGPNHQSQVADYPFFQKSNPDDPNSATTRNVNDVTSSQGVFNSKFNSVSPGASTDNFTLTPDPVFKVGSLNTRRVEPRNTPTTVNAVFNFRNFWDGRAQYLFNGVNPFGARDSAARVFKNAGSLQAVQVRIDNASLASQAVGPPSSNFEMSADGRTLMDIGKRLLPARPLALQKIDPSDSVLGPYAAPTTGLNITATYADVIRSAFKPEWWNGSQAVQVDATGKKTIIPMPANLANNQYTQIQANFSLFWGLAIQLYEATLVADDTPFDRYMAGDSSAMTSDQKAGLELFLGKGKCINCHGGAEFTNASVRKTVNEPLSRMVMGNGGVAVYDEGFYNTAVTPTLEDILNGGRDAFGKPLSLTGIAQKYGSSAFKQMIGISPNLSVRAGERIAVMGAAKTPTVRNVELTHPQMHNGGLLNLRHVVEFYNRGGNFKQANINDVDPDIERLGLSETEKNQLIAFMKALTDDRVRRDAAPFDHPELRLPNGHVGNESSVTFDAGHAKDDTVTLPAIGAKGGAGMVSPNFLNVAD